MSPAAVAFASACSAPGPVAAVVVGAREVVVVACVVVACVVVGAVAAGRLEPPHPASSAASPPTAEALTIRIMLAGSRRGPQPPPQRGARAPRATGRPPPRRGGG